MDLQAILQQINAMLQLVKQQEAELKAMKIAVLAMSQKGTTSC